MHNLQAVPVAEPYWAGAQQSLCLHVSSTCPCVKQAAPFAQLHSQCIAIRPQPQTEKHQSLHPSIHPSKINALQAVPVAEPDWSGAHRGLCLYVSRLLQPFLAKTPLGPPKPGDSNLTAHLSPESLQVRQAPKP